VNIRRQFQTYAYDTHRHETTAARELIGLTDVRITYIGGPTALIEVGPWRLLTDPTFDPPGKRYFFGWGTASKKLQGPAVAFDDLGTIDAVLISHDHHGDNLDPTGRELLPRMGQIITTEPGAKRLGGSAIGLAPWATTTLEGEGRPRIEITATPCRHGPPGSKPIVGHVVGFALKWDGQEHGVLWISGDTVLYDGVREVAQRLDVGTAVVHLGGVTFPWLSGPLRYTMNAQEAVELCGLVDPHTIIPIHYEGWKHFRQGRGPAEKVFGASPLAPRVTWLTAGAPTELDV
jgi:L-ascorbate metabolism protein UlaG (beta-lactamase superfamily)